MLNKSKLADSVTFPGFYGLLLIIAVIIIGVHSVQLITGIYSEVMLRLENIGVEWRNHFSDIALAASVVFAFLTLLLIRKGFNTKWRFFKYPLFVINASFFAHYITQQRIVENFDPMVFSAGLISGYIAYLLMLRMCLDDQVTV